MTAYKVWSGGAWVTLGGGGGSAVSTLGYSPLLGDGVNTGSSTRNGAQVSLTASATPHSPGAWVEVDASLSAAADGVTIHIDSNVNSGATDTSTLLEIGTGAASSETVWATVAIGYSQRSLYHVPGRIASGTRVAARLRSAVASKAVSGIGFMFQQALTPGLGAPVTLGADTATSRGAALTAPGATNTKGAWTQLSASTPSDIEALAFSAQGNGLTTMANGGLLLDIGIGGAGSETVLIGDIWLAADTAEFYTVRGPSTYQVSIPAGSRVAARYQCSNLNNAVDLILVGAASA